MIIVTFSDPEEQIVEKIKAVLAEDHEIECIQIADGREMNFGDVEIQTKQRKVFLRGKEVELTAREFDVLYSFILSNEFQCTFSANSFFSRFS